MYYLLGSLFKSIHHCMNAFVSLFLWSFKFRLLIFLSLRVVSFRWLHRRVTFFLRSIFILPRWSRYLLLLLFINYGKLLSLFNKLSDSLNYWTLLLYIQNIGSAYLSKNIKRQLYKCINTTALILIFEYVVKILDQYLFTCFN